MHGVPHFTYVSVNDAQVDRDEEKGEEERKEEGW